MELDASDMNIVGKGRYIITGTHGFNATTGVPNNCDATFVGTDESTLHVPAVISGYPINQIVGDLDVTALADNACFGNSSLNSVIVDVSNISQNPAEMGRDVFCYSSVASATIIGEFVMPGMFIDCSNLSSLTLPNNLTAIYDHAFKRCMGLTGTLELPESVEQIGVGAFNECRNLKKLIIPNAFFRYEAADDGELFYEDVSRDFKCYVSQHAFPQLYNDISYCDSQWSTAYADMLNPFVYFDEPWMFFACPRPVAFGSDVQCYNLTDYDISSHRGTAEQVMTPFLAKDCGVIVKGTEGTRTYLECADSGTAIDGLLVGTMDYVARLYAGDYVFNYERATFVKASKDSWIFPGYAYLHIDGCTLDEIPLSDFFKTDVVGDINGDGDVDVNDLNILINVMLGRDTNPAADLNGDGDVDVNDLNILINAMLGK